MSEMNSTLPVREETGGDSQAPKGPTKFKKGKQKKAKSKGKKVLIYILIAALLLTGVIVPRWLKRQSTNQFITAMAAKGDISVTISGSGAVTPIEEYTVTTPATGEVVGDYIKEGQQIKEGDLLYQIEDGNVQNNIQQAQINVQKAQQTYSQSVEAIDGMTVTAPFSGVLIAVSVKEGDSIQSGMKLAELTDMAHMTLTLPFNAGDAGNISVGAQATVILTSTGERRTGTVTRKYTGTSVSATGAVTSDIEIELSDASGIAKETQAAAVVGGISCNAAGTIEYKNQTTISAKTGGTVASLNFKAGDMISSGEVLLTIDNDQTVLSASSNEMSILNAKTALDNAEKQLDNYNLKSTINGTVIQKNTKFGDDLSGGEKLAVISDMSKVKFDIDVDELDITKVSKGQTVSVAADAITDKTFTGTVDYVSSIGTTQNGVTVYPVTIIVDGGMVDGLKPGMNVTGTIAVQSATDVVRVPVSAVQRGNMVLVKSSSLSGSEAAAQSGAFSGTDAASIDESGMPQNANGNAVSGTESATGNSSNGKRRRVFTNGSTSAGENGTPDGSTGNATDTASTNSKSGALKSLIEQRKSSGIGSVIKAGKNGIPEGYEYVQVTLGLSDSSFIEVKSGLPAGAIIAMPVQKTTQSSSSAANQKAMSFGMGGFGAAPSGNVRIREYTGSSSGNTPPKNASSGG